MKLKSGCSEDGEKEDNKCTLL